MYAIRWICTAPGVLVAIGSARSSAVTNIGFSPLKVYLLTIFGFTFYGEENGTSCWGFPPTFMSRRSSTHGKLVKTGAKLVLNSSQLVLNSS